MYNENNKWIFVHPQKCGGVSIEQILRRHYGHDKVIMTYENQHYNISDYDKIVKYSIDSYFKFGCIRNPWDRMVSLYYHAKRHDQYDKGFNEYITENKGLYEKERRGMQGYHKFCNKGEYALDFVVKLENFENDVKLLTNQLGIKQYYLPHFNHDTNRPNRNYREYYSEKTKSFIEEKFAWDIEFFQYQF